MITGVGVVCALGLSSAEFFAALQRGASNIGPIKHLDASSLPVQVAGEVPLLTIDAATLLQRDFAFSTSQQDLLWHAQDCGVFRDRKVGCLLLAAQEAWQMARCGAAEQAASLSIALGLEEAFLEDFAAAMKPASDGVKIDFLADTMPVAAHTRATPQRHSGIRFRSTVDLGARVLAQLFALRGVHAVQASACAGGGLAIAHAAAQIEHGAAEIVMCGGADSMVNALGLAGMARLGAPSPRHTSDACRPFDRRRDGLVIGEGAAVFIVESADRASARGVRPLAHIAGWGRSQDGYHATAPRPDGSAAARAMQQALRQAGVSPAQLGYINAHGTGTPLNDVAESQAICAALGPAGEQVPVSSIKGAVGHLMAAAGALELAACLLPFSHAILPGTAHHQQRDPACAINVIAETPQAANVDTVLSNSFGFGGQNVSILLQRADA